MHLPRHLPHLGGHLRRPSGSATSALAHDSASALRRSFLFGSLSRVSLAKVVGELDEVEFAPGQALLREGEPGDGLYIIRTGEAQLYTGPQPDADDDPVLIPPGEALGEIALLTHSVSSSTVVARTHVTCWRLSAERFLTLLGQERSIAMALEQTLGDRLGHAVHQAMSYQRAGHHLAGLLRPLLSEKAALLIACAGLLHQWPADVLEKTCADHGYAAALDELREAGLVTAGDGAYEVSPFFVRAWSWDALDRAWVAAAAARLEERGEWARAVDLQVRTHNTPAVARLLTAHKDELLAGSTPEEVGLWQVYVEQAAPELLEPLADLWAAEEAGSHHLAAQRHDVEQLRAAGAHVHEGGMHRWWLRHVPEPPLLATLAAIALYALGWVLPPPAGLERPAIVVLGALAASVPLLLFDVLPNYAVAIALATSVLMPGIVSPAEMLAGFASTSWLLILVLLAISTTIARSGILFRAALLSLTRFPGHFVVQSMALSVIGFVLTAGLSSRNARVTLAAPTAKEASNALRYPPRSPGSIALGMVALVSFGDLTTLFVTGSTISLLLVGLMPEATRNQFTPLYWFAAALVPNLVLFVLSYSAILVIYRPPMHTPIDRTKVRTQLELLGPISRAEVVSLLALVLLILGFVTQPYHGVAIVWVAICVFVGLVASGVLDEASFHRGADLGLLTYFGVLLSLGGLFTSLGLDRWLTDTLTAPLGGMAGNPYLFMLIVSAAAAVLHFVVPYNTASPVLALVSIPVAIANSYSPFLPVIAVLMAGDHSFAPYTSLPYLALYSGSDGELFTHRQASPLLKLNAGFRIIALTVSVPVWQLMGLA